ncbi:protein kinase family protein [Cellulomonas marina]|uniref:Protein kinase domain-containing protein n=1 Tax=Cellulomonas marina TaxID=988821 RepID=A0A1I0YHB5_9CELL|nr:protein kinase family protein [Cellulomonas marina]GIG28672.1 hypothetical protein Cma02nite_12720 [Cellulomonas marina]SFB12724.1 hypothetical protein SAMN05421867_107173 [Cellulomonas marina]
MTEAVGPLRVEPGTLLAGRYALDRPVGSDVAGTRAWAATDRILDRPVRVLLLADGPVARALDAARRAALVPDPRLARVLDVGQAADVGGYVVGERVDGPTLADLTARGPLTGPQARALVGEAASALEAARHRGVHHLALRPSVLHVTTTGRVLLTGLALDGVLLDQPDGDARATARADAVGLVRLLYTALTGRWPGDEASAGGLPPAPLVEGRPVPPADLVPDVPNDLDTLCAVTLGPHDDGPWTPAELVRDLEPWGEIRATALGPTGGPALVGPATGSVPVVAPPPPGAPQWSSVRSWSDVLAPADEAAAGSPVLAWAPVAAPGTTPAADADDDAPDDAPDEDVTDEHVTDDEAHGDAIDHAVDDAMDDAMDDAVDDTVREDVTDDGVADDDEPGGDERGGDELRDHGGPTDGGPTDGAADEQPSDDEPVDGRPFGAGTPEPGDDGTPDASPAGPVSAPVRRTSVREVVQARPSLRPGTPPPAFPPARLRHRGHRPSGGGSTAAGAAAFGAGAAGAAAVAAAAARRPDGPDGTTADPRSEAVEQAAVPHASVLPDPYGPAASAPTPPTGTPMAAGTSGEQPTVGTRPGHDEPPATTGSVALGDGVLDVGPGAVGDPVTVSTPRRIPLIARTGVPSSGTTTTPPAATSEPPVTGAGTGTDPVAAAAAAPSAPDPVDEEWDVIGVIADDDEPRRRGLDGGVVALLLVLVLVVAGVAVATRSLLAPVTADPAPTTSDPAAAAEPTAPEGEPAASAPEAPPPPAPPAIAGLTSIDPTDPAGEHPEAVAAALDGDPATAWYTYTYRTSALGGLKAGVGLAVTLAQPATVTTVTLRVNGPGGTSVELRSTDAANPTAGDVLASGTVGPETVLTLATPTETASLVLWFPAVPPAPDGDRFRLEVAELAVS